MHPEFPSPLYLVISEGDCRHQSWLTVAEEAIIGGVDIIQLREKNDSYESFLAKAKALKTLTDRYGIPLVINDQVDIAVQVEAWGIHVGQTDTAPSQIKEAHGDRFRIGWSLEQLSQLSSSELQAVHHLGLSPIFATATKTNTITEWGLSGIADIRQRTEKPIIAIGSMNKTNAKAAIAAGANSVAVVSAICAQRDPRAAAAELKELLR